jgi:hypothetical protein
MFTLLVVSVLSLVSGTAWCHEAEIRQVLEQNFQACTDENIEVLMGTQAQGLPQPALQEFQRQAEDVFAKTDMYLGLEACEVTAVQLPFAAARVVQVTLPKDPALRQDPDELARFYRDNSALLPAYERVEYVQTFKRENGRWKLWQITTEPRPVGQASQKQPVRSNCPNGRCGQKRSNSLFQ